MPSIGELYKLVEENQMGDTKPTLIWKRLNPSAFLIISKATADEAINYGPLFDHLKDKLDRDSMVNVTIDSEWKIMSTIKDIPAIVNAIAYVYDNSLGEVYEYQDTIVDPKAYFDNAPEHVKTVEKLVDVLSAMTNEDLDYDRVNAKTMYEFKDVTSAVKQSHPSVNLNESLKDSQSFNTFLSSPDAVSMTEDFIDQRGLRMSGNIKIKRIYEALESDISDPESATGQDIKDLTSDLDEQTIMQLYSEITGKSPLEFDDNMRAVVANHIKNYKETTTGQAVLGTNKDDEKSEMGHQEVFESYGVDISTKKLLSYRVPFIIKKVNESLHRITLKRNGKFGVSEYKKA